MVGEPVEDAVPGGIVHAQLGEQLPVEIRVAEAEDSAAEADRVEGGAQDLEHLGGPIGGVRSDQLDPRVHELANCARCGLTTR